MDGYNPSPYQKPVKSYDRNAKPPDVTALLKSNRFITYGEAQLHYISTRLGKLKKEGFVFWYPGAPSEWPESYLESVLSHSSSLTVLRMRQIWEAEHTTSNDLPPQESEKTQQTAMSLVESLAGVYKGKPVKQVGNKK